MSDGDSFYHFRERDKFLAWLYERAVSNVHVYLCAVNLEYELINCFSDLWDHLDLKLKNHGLTIVSARLRGTRVAFYDTLNHWPIGVATMGQRIGLPKLAMDKTGWDYVDRDVEITLRHAQMMQTSYNDFGANFNATLPSSALDLYRRHYLPVAIARPPTALLDRIMEGYYGGRVEVFRTDPGVGSFYYIDVNSMYPFVMQRSYPNPNDWTFGSSERIDGFGMANATVQVPSTYLPLLPLRHDERLLFPVGRFTGTWTFDELRAASDRGVRIVKVHWTIRYPNAFRPFERYVAALYARKDRAVDETERNTAKLFLNSLYGKMGERIDDYAFMPADKVPPDRGAVLYGNMAVVEMGERYPNHCNGILAAYTTAYARLHLQEQLESIRSNGGEVWYCDTDSIVYRSDRPLHVESSDLGGWKLEKRLSFCHFLQPKVYAFREIEKPELQVRAKGVPRNASVRYYSEGTATFSRPYRLRSLLRRGLKGAVWHETSKTLRSTLKKRRILTGGDTAAIVITKRSVNERKGKPNA